MSRRAWLAPLVVALGLGAAASGCSAVESDGLPPGDDSAVAASESGKRAQPRSWSGIYAEKYEDSFRICSVFTVKEVARDYGVAPRPRVAAQAHAREQYGPAFRRAAFEGCIDAFKGRPSGLVR